MTATGGSVETVGINGRTFPAAADAEGNRKLGGWQNEVEANGDGSARIIKTRIPWSFEGITVEIDDDRGDQEFLQDIVDGNDYVPITVTFASGNVYQGTGMVTGDLQFASQSSTASLNLMGSGKMTKQ